MGVGAVALCAPRPLRAAGRGGKRPNILFLLSDDQRADTIGAHGNPHIRTPNLDKLVARGFSFRRNYCFGGNSGAVCVPSRAMINSGKTFFDVPRDLKGVKVLAELLREQGYVTFGTGKWHNGAPSFLRGFAQGKAVFFGGMSDHTRVPVVDFSPDGKLVNRRTGAKFSSELFADAAIDFIEHHKRDRPFYAYVAFTAPHDPRQPPPKYRKMYYDSRPPLPKNFLPQHSFDNGHCAGGRDEGLAAWPRTKAVVSDQLAEYYGMITHMDEQIGRILAALERSGQAANTIVIFASDQGLAVGSHGLLGKQSVYEHSMGAPLIFAGPGVPKGKSSQAFTYLLDIFPTVCALTGTAAPGDLAGHDLAPIWRGRVEKVRDSVFLPFRHLMRAVRDERWKLICYPPINHVQLFDLANDPDERHDLAADPAHAGRIQRMTAMLRAWQKKVGDTQALTVAKPKPKQIDLTGRKRKPDRWQPKWIRAKYFGESE
jgi:arylsulfatase A-like enzyme